MDFFSVPHLLLILVLVVLLFGAGKLPRVMGDFAKGIKAFKAGMQDEGEAEPKQQVNPPPASSQPPPSGTSNPPHEHA